MSDIVIEETNETKIYLGDAGRIVISQAGPLGDDPACILIWPKDIPAVIKRLRDIRKESRNVSEPKGLIGLKEDSE